MESVATWGENQNTTNWLLLHDCWALRRGSYHLSSLNSPALQMAISLANLELR